MIISSSFSDLELLLSVIWVILLESMIVPTICYRSVIISYLSDAPRKDKSAFHWAVVIGNLSDAPRKDE